MSLRMSRRDLLHIGSGTAATLAMTAFGCETADVFAQSLPVRNVPKDYKEDLFYREDWLGEPWRKPETAVLIHGNDESSTEWYAWIPRMAQQYRLIRPDLPGLLEAIINRAMQKRSADRFQVGTEMATALRNCSRLLQAQGL